MDRLTVPLEVGKKYVCRDGQVRTVRAAGSLAGESIVSLGDTYVYSKTGVVCGHSNHPHDIVADYIEPAKGHPHAALMALYAQDAAETDKPWGRWEYRNEDSNVWLGPMAVSPSWYLNCQYRRRKSKTIRIGEYDVPEPMRVAPAGGVGYWMPLLGQNGPRSYAWRGDELDQWFLTAGLVHATREAADTHAKALISLSSP